MVGLAVIRWAPIWDVGDVKTAVLNRALGRLGKLWSGDGGSQFAIPMHAVNPDRKSHEHDLFRGQMGRAGGIVKRVVSVRRLTIQHQLCCFNCNRWRSVFATFAEQVPS